MILYVLVQQIIFLSANKKIKISFPCLTNGKLKWPEYLSELMYKDCNLLYSTPSIMYFFLKTAAAIHFYRASDIGFVRSYSD